MANMHKTFHSLPALLEFLRSQRQAHGLSQERLADFLAISSSKLSRLENGLLKRNHQELLARYAGAVGLFLDISADYTLHS